MDAMLMRWAREVAPALEMLPGGVTPDFGIVGAQIGAQGRGGR